MKAPEEKKPSAAPEGLERLIGRSPAMEALRETVRRLAPLDASVLIIGETGAGKELVARAIHDCSARAAEPFLAINCGAIAETLLESELFGHEKGAFTGAHQTHRGIFEEAGRGTVLLDEIGDIPPRLQVALLRVLEAGEIRPVGSSRTRQIACRVLAATNADLEARSATGQFRKDLFFRLKRLEVRVPPLRERREDVLFLAGHFFAEGRAAGQQPSMDQALRDELRARDWPGNVRELKNAVERMRLLHSDKLAYGIEDLSLEGGSAAARPAAPSAAGSAAGRERGAASEDSVGRMLAKGTTSLRRLDRLRELFRQHGKLTRAEAASILGVSLPTATRDLQQLAAEGLIEKVAPTASPRTHYFALKSLGLGASVPLTGVPVRLKPPPKNNRPIDVRWVDKPETGGAKPKKDSPLQNT